jgi:hypothetical protein
MASQQPSGGKKKPPPGATTRQGGRASTIPGRETQGPDKLSTAMQVALTEDVTRRGNTPARHYDRPPESRMMTPGMLDLRADDLSGSGESETVEDITPQPATFAPRLART